MVADDYFKGLTEAEWAEHQRIEAELNGLVCGGFSERAALAFVKAVVSIRKTFPEATVEGVFDAALIGGLEVLVLSERSEAPPARRPKRKARTGARLVT